MGQHCARHGSWRLLLLLALWSLQAAEAKPENGPLPSVFHDFMPVKKVLPRYPPEAEAKHLEGRVRVRLTVEVDGKVSEAKVLAADPPGVFDAAAMEAVVQYIFRRNGSSYQADQEIVFRLE